MGSNQNIKAQVRAGKLCYVCETRPPARWDPDALAGKCKECTDEEHQEWERILERDANKLYRAYQAGEQGYNGIED